MALQPIPIPPPNQSPVVSNSPPVPAGAGEPADGCARRRDPVYLAPLEGVPSDSAYFAVLTGRELLAQAGVVEPIWYWLPELIALYNQTVGIVDAETGDILVYNETSGQWEAVPGSSIIGSIQLDELSDVNAPSPATDNILVYNETSGQWEAVPGSSIIGSIQLDELSDVNAPSPAADDILAYNGTSGEWENRVVAAYGVEGVNEVINAGRRRALMSLY